MNRSTKFALLALLALTLAACVAPSQPPEEPQMCTLMACVDTLEVRVINPPALPYWVTVRADGQEFLIACEEETEASEATLGKDCENGVFTLFEFSPEMASVEIGWAAGGIIIDAIPDYETFRPNGPGCDPECRSGVVSVELP